MAGKTDKRDKDPKTGRFLNGNTGGPGRPKGSTRKELAREFLEDVRRLWAQQGSAVLERVIETDPAAFLRAMVALVPKEVDLNINRYDELSDEQLRAQVLAAIREARELGIDIGIEDAPKLH